MKKIQTNRVWEIEKKNKAEKIAWLAGKECETQTFMGIKIGVQELLGEYGNPDPEVVILGGI